MVLRTRDLWNRRYGTEGQVWGTHFSPTLEVLSCELAPPAAVLEVGFGYGRDMRELLARGYRVDGIELSIQGLSMAAAELNLPSNQVPARLFLGDYGSAPIESGYYDAVFSHRTLHLLPEAELGRFVAQTSRILRPGGLVCVSARDERDYNQHQMRWIGPGMAEYTLPERQGHRVSFWSEERFVDVFSPHFSSFRFLSSSEQESEENLGAKAYFTIMLAQRPV